MTNTILVVEDADAVRHFVTVALRHLGYEVIAADTVAEARARFEAISGRVSLLLSDVVLPDGTGPDLYRMLTALSPRLRLLLISGYPYEDLNPLPAEERMGDILLKPFGLMTLAAKVRAALEHRTP